jgi:hypothetical protein
MNLLLQSEINEALAISNLTNNNKIILYLDIDKFNNIFEGSFTQLQTEVKKICIVYKINCSINLGEDIVYKKVNRELLPESYPKDKEEPKYYTNSTCIRIVFERN